MSRENVELVRLGLDAFLAGDFERAFARLHAEVVTVRAAPLPDPETYHGREGVLRTMADWTRDFRNFEMTAGEFIDAGDYVVVEVHQRAQGHASGAPVEGTFWFVYKLVDGYVTRQEVYAEQKQALAAAGLSAPRRP